MGSSFEVGVSGGAVGMEPAMQSCVHIYIPAGRSRGKAMLRLYTYTVCIVGQTHRSYS